jgi:hypothetical protein
MKLITKTITNPAGHGFFFSPEYIAYIMLQHVLHVDCSISFHDDNTKIYMVEIVEDRYVDVLLSKWDLVLEAEDLEVRGMTATIRVEDAFNKK